jgi:hypothetical protein
MKFLVYLMTLLFSTAVAQNPTILQGNYVSNVFGNSNFVLNPNAQTNVANVTTVTATVARSTTTPLVATSEFTVAIGTANGTATWATRAFDAGMKGQNCEARFSYRGFAATSIVQIKQSTNVVASLTLTPATDPRIASINFPCGDLSAATTFVVTDTAILAGTNEIGGIYVGLATNMANVAQAEFVGAVKWNATTNCLWMIGGNVTSYGNFPADADCTTPTSGDIEGQASAPSTKVPGITFANLKPGRYIFTATGSMQTGGGSGTAGGIAYYAYFRFHDGTNAAKNENQTYMTRTTGNDGPGVPVISGEFEYSAAQSNVTIQIQGKTNSVSPNAAFAVIGAATTPLYISVYRFPLASELVVTPERQNTWAGVVYTVEAQSLLIGTPEPTASTPYTSALWNKPTKLKGKASVTTTNSGNDLGFSVANLPVGNYKLDVSGILNASSAAVVGARVQCNFLLIETTTATEITSQAHQDAQFSVDGTRDYTNSFTGVFNNTSVGTRNFRIEAQKQADNTAGDVGYCQAYSNTIPNGINTKLAIIMTPLDQPSNSALYVQGPVKAAATGAAIPAGYVGQKFVGAGSDVTPANIVWTGFANSGALPAGIYSCVAYVDVEPAGGSFDIGSLTISTVNNTAGTVIQSIIKPIGGDYKTQATMTSLQISSTGTTTAYANVRFQNATGTPKPYVVGVNSGIECTRLN